VWLAVFFSVLTCVHDLFDALTNGGLGIALFAPFDNTRYFLPVTPIEVSPIGIRGLSLGRLGEVFRSEFWWVWCPSLAFALIVVGVRRLWRKRPRGPTSA
jgi:inner membrane protein